MAPVEDELAKAFRCAKCGQEQAHVEHLSMSGAGFFRLFEVQPYRYAFVTCTNCGFTEVYGLRVLQGKDDLGTILEVIFADSFYPAEWAASVDFEAWVDERRSRRLLTVG